MPPLVLGEGSKDAKIWMFGEAPGAQEEIVGRPFIGGAGKVLEGILREVGIKRNEVYIDNVIQRRPPGNDFSIFYTDKGKKNPTEELQSRWRAVQDLITTHKPNVVVALGNEALRATTGKNQITHWRGSILGCKGVKVVPTIHPAMVMRQYEYRPIVALDIQRAKRESISPNFPLPYKDRFILSPTFDKVMETLKFLETQEYIAFDIETGQEQILCIGFGWSKEDSICVPIFYSGTSWWTVEEETAIIKQIRILFSNPRIKFIAQNAQFDMIYLADKWKVEVANLWMDTMILMHCVYPELKKGLAFLCSIYTNRPYYKDMPGTGGPDVLWKYNCLDTVVTYECAMALQKEAEEFGTLNFYKENSHKLIKPLIQMQRRGVKIDTKTRQEIDKTLTRDEQTLCERLQKAVGHELNPSSSKQMKDFLYTELKMPPQVDAKTGNLTTDEEALEALFKKFDSPIFRLISDIRKLRKLLSTYIRAEIDPDGRMRCSYVITGTETGRLSSRESVYGRGTNLQNIPRGDLVRTIFIPDEGNVLINADLNKAEARGVAYLAREERLQNMLNNTKDDFYKYLAATFTKKGIKEVSETERQSFKQVVHAAHYMVGDRKLAVLLGCSTDRARELLNFYYALCPSIKQWHLEVEATISRSKIMRTPLGRARMFFGRWSQDLIREAVAYVPQSLISDIINLGIIRAYPNLPPGWELLLQVHDAILMQVPEETPHIQIKKFIEHFFEFPVEINGKQMIIPVDIKLGKNWANMKKMEL